MAYQIDRFNGTLLVSLDDQTINTTATDIRLVGRNYSGYGEIQNENFVHLLENFSNSSPPPRPLSGQIWFDSVNRKLKFYDGVKFKVASGSEASAVAPSGLSPGDFWFDTAEEQLYAWNGTDFILVGPERAPVLGETEAIPVVVKDSINADRNIIKLQVGSETVAIISNEEFIINNIINPIPGFTIVKRGFTLSGLNTNDNTTSTDYRIWGTASNADKLNGFTSDDFLRSANTVFSTQVKFSDSGFTVGDQNDLRITVVNGNEPVIENTLGQPIIFRISSVAETRDIALFNTSGVVPGSTDLYDLGQPGIRWREVNAETMRADTFYGTFVGNLQTPANLDGSIPPVTFDSITVTSDFTMNDGRFTIDLEDTSGVIELRSGVVGTIDNVEIGNTIPKRATFTDLTVSGSTRLTQNVNSTSTTTGSLVVTGGVGMSGNLFVGGNATVTSTGYFKIPVGTDAQRPTAPTVGMVRFNTTTESFEGYNGTDWVLLSGEFDEDYGVIIPTLAINLANPLEFALSSEVSIGPYSTYSNATALAEPSLGSTTVVVFGFGTLATGTVVRTLTTNGKINLVSASSLVYEVNVGNSSGWGDIPESGEDFYLEYSVDGTAWVVLDSTLTTVTPNTWIIKTVTVPSGAKVSGGVYLRYRHTKSSDLATPRDTWAASNLTIVPVYDAFEDIIDYGGIL